MYCGETSIYNIVVIKQTHINNDALTFNVKKNLKLNTKCIQ